MKRFFILLLALTFAAASLFAQEKVIRILAIGNSFSEDAVEQNLWNIAQADGVQLIIGNMYIGGCTIERHVNNMRDNKADYAYRKIGLDGQKVQTRNFTLAQAVADEPWDYISVQQASGVSGMYESYALLPELVAWIRRTAPQAQVIFHQTWAYSQTSTHQEFPNYDSDQITMYYAIQDASARAVKDNDIDILVPSGRAIQYARCMVPEKNITRDGYHLNMRYGRFIAAATWYETLCGKSILNNPYRPANITDEELAKAKLAVAAAVHGPLPFAIFQ